MDIAALVDRFEHYAATNKELRHVKDSERNQAFYHIDLEDYQQALSWNAKPMGLLLQTPEVEKDGIYDNVTEAYDFTFVVLNHRPRVAKAVLVNEAKIVADKIFNRLMRDASNDEDTYGMLEGTAEGIFGPVSDGVYGWAVAVTVTAPYDGEVNPADWTDLDPGGTP